MDSDSWARLENLFHRALALSPAQRIEFLHKECGTDRELLQQVTGLVAHSEAEPDFLESAAVSTEPAANLRSTIAPGQSVGFYKVLTHLGSGGMSDVYLAQDDRLNRFVALKVLVSGPRADTGIVPRHLREAQAASALNHPGIVTVHDAGEVDGREFIVTEFVEGITLRERLREPIPIEEAVGIAKQVASALAAAHEREIIHRDLKPENIMIRADGIAKILDFGLAGLSTQSDASIPGMKGLRSATVLGNTLLIGSIPYMSPEQIRAEPVDARSDIFSLGALLYEMLTGRRAFDAASNLKTLLAILYGTPAPVKRWNRRASVRLVGVIETCLQKNSADRFQDARQVRDALADVKVRPVRKRVRIAGL